MIHEIIMEIQDEDFHKYGLEGCREVVRCKYCKHNEDEQAGMVYCQHVIGGWADEEWFCADGERKES